jgi:hypothetical protein
MQEKYTEIRREHEMKLKSYFEDRFNRVVVAQNNNATDKTGVIGGGTRVRKFQTNNRSRPRTRSRSPRRLTAASLDAATAAGKPSLLLVDDDHYSDIAASDVSPLGMSSLGNSRYSLDEWPQDNFQKHVDEEIDSLGFSESAWTPSEAAREIFNLTDHRLSLDRLLLHKQGMQHFDELSAGEKVLAMHATFHKIQRESDQQRMVSCCS